MSISLRSLFCCFADPDQTLKSSNSKAPSANTSAPSKTQRPDEKKSDKPSAASQGRHGEKRPSHSLQQDQIPLDFINPAEPLPEELAVKGRRLSSPVISPSAKNTHMSNNSRRSNSQDLHGTPRSGNSGDIEVHPKGQNQDERDSVYAPLHLDLDGYEEPAEVGEVADPEEESSMNYDLLPPLPEEMKNRKCLVLDLDETLVHSSFKYIWNADFIIPVEIEGTVHDVYVVKRPGVDEFLDRVGEIYEVVVFTASVAKYGDPLLDRLDTKHKVHHRLFRESCLNIQGNYIKNLLWLGRPIEDIIIVDNSPAAYVLQPHNAVPVSSWFSDVHDNELLDMLPFLEDLAGQAVPNVLTVLGHDW